MLTDTLPAGSTPNYRIVARDGDGNVADSETVAITVGGAVGSNYAETVMDDGASLYWRLGGTAAQGGNDLVGNNDAVVRSGVTSNSERRAALGARARRTPSTGPRAGTSTPRTT